MGLIGLARRLRYWTSRSSSVVDSEEPGIEVPEEWRCTPSFQEDLAQECRRALTQDRERIELNDQTLLDHVVGAGGTASGFLYGGFMTSVGLRAVLRLAGETVSSFSRVVDFGCGPARVAHWFCDIVPRSELIGTDIDPEAIRWCSENVHVGATFHVNGHVPPLPLSDESVDLLYGISVFTHLDEEYQFRWMEELNRVIRVGGLAFLTFHGTDCARLSLPGPEFTAFQRRGFAYFNLGDDPSVAGLPDFYQAAFHAESYVEQHWCRHFNPVLSVQHGPFWTQSGILLRKAPPDSVSNAGGRVPRVSLPFVALDSPSADATLAGDVLEIAGWAFDPHHRDSLEVTAWIDGKACGRSMADERRKDVALAYPNYSHAKASGFRFATSVRETEPGAHALWLTVPHSNVPIAATYFWKTD